MQECSAAGRIRLTEMQVATQKRLTAGKVQTVLAKQSSAVPTGVPPTAAQMVPTGVPPTAERIELTGMADWLGDQKGLLSWKLDGLTIVLTYRDGKLFKAVTRGNGEVGEVITPNAKTFVNVPLQIPYQGELILRGEAVITYADLKRSTAKSKTWTLGTKIRETSAPVPYAS